MILRLTGKKEKINNRYAQWGSVKDIEDKLEPGSSKNISFPSSEITTLSTPYVSESNGNGNKTKIQMNRLFGSKKPYGLLPERPGRQPYSKKRVFQS